MRRASAPRRHARIDLGDTRSESFGEWLFNHRVGLLVVFAVFVLSGTVLATARYDVERIDLEYLIEIVPEEFEEQPVRETKPIPSIEELSQRVQNVRNVISNDAATEQSSGSESFDEDLERLMEEIEEGMDANRAAYEEGMNSVRGAGKGGKGGGDDKGDAKDENDKAKGKYQGNCTVTYSFEQPVRHHRNLYVPAYTAKGGGVVVLEVFLDRNGAVTSARVASSTNTSLNQVAIQAARNYNTRFNIDGSAPSPHKGTITYTFIAQ
ncbi:MAG: energy transducer TonB [Alistipes sp.]|nr:energy transducer TonB [Alistipes sp.]